MSKAGFLDQAHGCACFVRMSNRPETRGEQSNQKNEHPCSILNRRTEKPRVEEGAFINGELKPGLVRCRLPDTTALNKVLRREDS